MTCASLKVMLLRFIKMKASGGKEAAEGNKGCFLPTMSRKGRQRYLWKLTLNLFGRESAWQTRSNTEHDVKLVCARVSVSKDTQMRGGRRSAGSEKEWRRSVRSFFPFLSLVPSSSLSRSFRRRLFVKFSGKKLREIKWFEKISVRVDEKQSRIFGNACYLFEMHR